MGAGHLTLAFIGLGSNLGEPEQNVRRAVHAISAAPGCRIVAVSSLYRSPPMGPRDQPDYINAVAKIATELTVRELLDELLRIERAHGRVRDGVRWGPRTLDLDILIYGTTRCAEPDLTIPHPGIAERAFVLYPLHEIDPDIRIPGLPPLRDMLAAHPLGSVERV